MFIWVVFIGFFFKDFLAYDGLGKCTEIRTVSFCENAYTEKVYFHIIIFSFI
jgi:hypothetical protein